MILCLPVNQGQLTTCVQAVKHCPKIRLELAVLMSSLGSASPLHLLYLISSIGHTTSPNLNVRAQPQFHLEQPSWLPRLLISSL